MEIDELSDDELGYLFGERAFGVFQVMTGEHLIKQLTQMPIDLFIKARKEIERRGFNEESLRSYLVKMLREDIRVVAEIAAEIAGEKIKCASCVRSYENSKIEGCSLGKPFDTDATKCKDFEKRTDGWDEGLDAPFLNENVKRQELIDRLIEGQTIQVAIGLGPKIVEK